MKKVGMENRGFSHAELAECESELCRLQIFAKEFHTLPRKLTFKPLLWAVSIYSGENPQCF